MSELLSMSAIKFDLSVYSKETLLKLYTDLLKPRLIEEKMMILLRQGKVSKWFSGIGQEAISVGALNALENDEYALPMHRNLGVFTTRNVPLERLFAQFQGKMSGFTKGRDRSFHFGSKGHSIVGMISHLGPQLSIADGIALANKIKKEKKATLVFTGDGGASQGEFHEALNVAAVWDLPVIFVVESNGYALSTPSNEQFRNSQFVDKAAGYGIDGVTIDGNNILEVYDTVNRISESIRKNPRPFLIDAVTFRMRGHEEASGTKYVPNELFEEWGQKDPISNFEVSLLEGGIISEKEIEGLKSKIKEEIATAWNTAEAEEKILPDTDREYADLFAPFDNKEIRPSGNAKSEKRFVDAISDGLRQSMEKHDNLVIMGQDVAEYGGVFKITEGFVDQFGKDRVRNTPLCESAIVGSALGLSIAGHKAMMEMQFADFVTCGFNQIINNLAKIHWRWGQNADVVIRMPTGAGVAAGPFHSQSNEAWFFHTPGLKVVYPSSPADAKGLLAASINDPNPVMFFEHKALYRSLKEDVNDDYYTLELGKANLVAEGDQVSIITYGYGVQWAKQYIAEHPEISADILDLRTLLPFDKEAIAETVKKTNKAIILHEDSLTGGIGAEISAFISDDLFAYLDAPVKRVGALDTPIPFAPQLEENFLPKARFEEALNALLKY